MSARRAAWLVLGVALVAGSAAAAITLAYSTSTVTTQGMSPPVVLVVGSGGNDSRYFAPPMSLSTNATSVTGTLKGHAGALSVVNDTLRTANNAGRSVSVTLSGTQVTNARVEEFMWKVYNGTTLVGTLDMRLANPALTFPLPAAETYKLQLRVDLADGAGRSNSPTSFDLRVVVS